MTRIRTKFKNKEYRDAFVESFVDTLIAAQIKSLREGAGLKQSELAEKAGMLQSRISTLENVNYSSWSVSTLRRLARAFDVALIVKFESFGRAIKESDSFAESLQVPSFDDDPAFHMVSSHAGKSAQVDEAFGLWLEQSFGEAYSIAGSALFSGMDRTINILSNIPATMITEPAGSTADTSRPN